MVYDVYPSGHGVVALPRRVSRHLLCRTSCAPMLGSTCPGWYVR